MFGAITIAMLLALIFVTSERPASLPRKQMRYLEEHRKRKVNDKTTSVMTLAAQPYHSMCSILTPPKAKVNGHNKDSAAFQHKMTAKGTSMFKLLTLDLQDLREEACSRLSNKLVVEHHCPVCYKEKQNGKSA